ncbi:MAG: NAD(P)/FAD-dependent oxidoreductase, partial [Pseudomonadota bacterium]
GNLTHDEAVTVHQNAARVPLKGRGGVMLDEQWGDESPEAHLGITAPNFPNFYVMQGPGTVLAHGGSAIFTSECMIRYVTSCLRAMVEGGHRAIEVREEAHDAYMARWYAEHDELIWSHPGMNNWYKNSKGKVFAVLPWRLVDYWAMTRDVDLSEYRLTG